MLNYTENPDAWQWHPYFSIHEFKCKGTGDCRMAPSFMDALFSLRKEFNAPMVITSGYRSPSYNASVSTTGDDGPHTYGCAVDISISRGEARRLVGLAIDFGFSGIGLRQHGPNRFVHLDIMPSAKNRPRPTIWTYP